MGDTTVDAGDLRSPSGIEVTDRQAPSCIGDVGIAPHGHGACCGLAEILGHGEVARDAQAAIRLCEGGQCDRTGTCKNATALDISVERDTASTHIQRASRLAERSVCPRQTVDLDWTALRRRYHRAAKADMDPRRNHHLGHI